MKKKKVVVIVIFFVFLIGLAGMWYLTFHKEKNWEHNDYTKLNLEGYNKLMVVAHPDDETLWGGAHLFDGKYLVVCVTCGPNSTRMKEFSSVMKKTGSQYVALGYPDKTKGERDNWNKDYKKIEKDLEKIYHLKDWDLIVTHNPDGEYGHIHHQMTSKIVTEKVTDKKKLYYFGRYYSKKKLADEKPDIPNIENDILIKKLDLIEIYKSQSFIKEKFNQMFSHEDWLEYSKWES